ncbi:MAG: MBL fold metallo-hydrolase [Thermomicrobiales bacterium]
MELIFLGTAAAEGYPDPFCACANCTEARELGGTSFRYRSSALIDGQLLIDMGPDLVAASMRHGIPLNAVRYGIQTHPHNDHLDVLSFFARHEGCNVEGIAMMEYACSASSTRRMNALESLESGTTDYADPEEQRRRRIALQTIEPWQEFRIGPYRIQTVRATHGGGMIEAMLFAIEGPDGGRLFYGTDTGTLADGTWERLAELGWVFDVFVLDHTGGVQVGPADAHHNAGTFVEEIARARAAGVIDDHTRVLCTHMAHHSNPTHDKLVTWTAESGYEPAFDGMRVMVSAPVQA